MKAAAILAAAAALASAPVDAQSAGAAADLWQPLRPNAQAAERPLGPNARAARRAEGPSAAVVRLNRPMGGEVYYPNCAAARTERTTPIRRGEPGYGRHLDRDGDGTACG